VNVNDGRQRKTTESKDKLYVEQNITGQQWGFGKVSPPKGR
jgi:hypothetical protein